MKKTAGIAAAFLISCSAIFAAEPAPKTPAPPAKARRTPSPEIPAEKFYKNIQVFQGLPSTDLMPAMNFMANSLGVKCSFCHVTDNTGRWPMERDDKAAKGRAREMIRMVREINRANFKGRLEVTCATCHHGSHDPVSTPPLLAESAAAHAASPAPPAAEPSVDAVLGKYMSAIGGADAMSKVRTRRLRGTFTGGDGEPHPIEILQADSKKYRSSVTVKDGVFTIAFDGKAGTTGGPDWNNPMQPSEIERIRWRAELFPAAGLKSEFPALAVHGHEAVAGRNAWVLQARDAEGRKATFWFDAENGFLLRALRFQRTALGDTPEQADYADYRDVDGVKVPFTIRHTAPDRTDTVTAAEVVQNVALDDSLFAPAPAK